MRCFVVAGQPSAALAQYETCRHILDEELGLEPDPATRELLREIRAQDLAPALNMPWEAAEARRLLTAAQGREAEDAPELTLARDQGATHG